jgi:hypothetical protein
MLKSLFLGLKSFQNLGVDLVKSVIISSFTKGRGSSNSLAGKW